MGLGQELTCARLRQLTPASAKESVDLCSLHFAGGRWLRSLVASRKSFIFPLSSPFHIGSAW